MGRRVMPDEFDAEAWLAQARASGLVVKTAHGLLYVRAKQNGDDGQSTVLNRLWGNEIAVVRHIELNLSNVDLRLPAE